MQNRVAELVAEAVAEGGEPVRSSRVVSAEVSDDARLTAVSVGLDGADDRLYYVREPADGGLPQLWLHPDDPRLPALQAVAFPHAVSIMLERMSLPTTLESLELLAYRPGRRAVARVVAGGRQFWLKVVRPTRVERIVAAHRALEEQGLPVPRLISWSPAGLLVLGAAEGVPMADVTRTASAEAVIAAVDRMRAAFALTPLEEPVRSIVRGRSAWYASVLGGTSTELGERAGRLALWVDWREGPVATSVAVHGDLHLGQLFACSAEDPTVVGVIDVDTAGIGDPADDSAAFISNALAASGLNADADDAGRLAEIARQAFRAWAVDRLDDPTMAERVRLSLVEHLLAQAAQLADRDSRIELASRLLATAESVVAGRGLELVGAGRADESPLRSVSSSPHRDPRV
ncbi:phosphotransferase family protein [Agromyces humatus]|uniref:Aminoglycoside phosphotransferase domain-containing protein n=1 Tax=Agromyces humatus TaxID=279573 RepID=A0ABN2KX17_9MICO|nr:phosphotransferase [Agromyces humatus]